MSNELVTSIGEDHGRTGDRYYSLEGLQPYGVEGVVVTPNTDRLLDDIKLRSEAKGVKFDKTPLATRGLALSTTAQSFSKHHFETVQMGEDLPAWVMGNTLPFTSKLYDLYLDKGCVGAHITCPSNPHVLINIPQILRYCKQVDKPNPDTVAAIINHQLYRTWRHEREHLLNIYLPEQRLKERLFDIAWAGTLVTLPYVVTKYGLVSLLSTIPHNHPEYNTVATLFGMATFSTGLATMQAISSLGYKYSLAEKSARKAEKNSDSLPNLFEIELV